MCTMGFRRESLVEIPRRIWRLVGHAEGGHGKGSVPGVSYRGFKVDFFSSFCIVVSTMVHGPRKILSNKV